MNEEGSYPWIVECASPVTSCRPFVVGSNREDSLAAWNRRDEPTRLPEVERLVAASRAFLAKFRSCGSAEARELFAALAPFERAAGGDSGKSSRDA